MCVNWIAYNQALIPLIQKFGAVTYSQNEIKQGYFFWKKRNLSDLIEQISLSISFNQPLELIKAVDQSKRPERSQWQPEEYEQSEGFLDNLLKSNNANSVMDLVDKYRASLKTS